MRWLVYGLFRIFIFCLSALPDKILYLISGGLRLLLLNVVGYRMHIVNANLTNSFPALSPTDLRSLRKKYYQHLSDILIESLASYGWSANRLQAHFKFLNPELLSGYIDQKQKIIGVSAHTGNFELGAVLTQHLLGLSCYAVYRPLTNPYIERFLSKKRSSLGITLRPDKKIGELIDMMTAPSILFLIADQNPANITKAIWVRFMEQDTAFAHGPASIAHMHRMPVIYFDIVRVRQGYYECTLSVLIERPGDFTEQEIMEQYASKLEKSLKKHPDDWLWSHKRWKWKREETQIVKTKVY